MVTEHSRNDGSKAQYYVVILDRLQDRSGGLERAPESRIRGPLTLELFRVEADSSDFTTGAVLSQQSTTDGKWHPMAFYSKFLSSVERNYEIHDKEMLAIICALEE